MQIDRPTLMINGADHSDVILWGLLILGVTKILFPGITWWMAYGWRYNESVEPSDLWIFWNRVAGVLLIVISAYMLTHPGPIRL